MRRDHTTTSDFSYAIRRAVADDAPALARLAALDSARPLAGDVLVALVDGAPWAALSLQDGRVVADPFRPSAHAVELLRLRAEHLARAGRGLTLRRRALRTLRA
ncbi:MAG TPA: hypothetical protein VD931_18700 [Baekduia sp.]|nr:hypothetical protein [Baekduia sp.]